MIKEIGEYATKMFQLSVLVSLLLIAGPALADEELTFMDAANQFTRFRLAATVSPETAFSVHATPSTAERLKEMNRFMSSATDDMKGWSFFFGTSVGTITSLSEEVVLTMFYCPWADVALLCEWRNLDGPKISDVELICGDILRETKQPELIPLWQRTPEIPPPLAIMVSANDSARAFMDLYGKQLWFGSTNWRKKLTLMKTKENVEGNYQAVRLLFNQMLASVSGFFNDPALANIRTSMDQVRDLLIDKNTDAVLAMAPETSAEARMILETAPLQWENATIVLLATNIKNAFVFMADLRYPEHYACFWFVKSDDNTAKLRRIDFLSHTLSFEEVDDIARQAGMDRP